MNIKTQNIMLSYHRHYRFCAHHLFVLNSIILFGIAMSSCSKNNDIDWQISDKESKPNIGIALNNADASVMQVSAEPFTRSVESEQTISRDLMFPFANTDTDLACDVAWGASNKTTRGSDTGYNLQWANIGSATQIAIQPRDYAATSYSTYSVSTSGAISATSPYYFETANRDVITSWYPYNSGSLSSFTVQTDQSTLANYIASDLLYTSAVVSATSQSLTYSHKMAQIIVDVTVSNVSQFPNSEVQSLTISGLKTSCTTDFASLSGNAVRYPTFTTGSTTATIKAYRRTRSSNSTTSTAEFIMCVPAQTISTSQVFTIKVGGITFTGKLANAQSLQSGYAYNVSISINGLPVSLVDMGTGDGLYWATCNVGASTPSAYGNYYEWGATSPYPSTPNASATWASNRTWAWLDYTGTLPSSNDIATITYGGNYRTPTVDEFNNLIDKCTWSTPTIGSIKGYQATAKANSHTIFIPMGGMYNTGEASKTSVGSISYLWSATSLIYSGSYKDAWDFNNAAMYSNYVRAKGMPIRAVYDTNK